MFSKPYLTNHSMNHTIKSSLVISLFLLLFFLAFKPFGLHDITPTDRIILSVAYAVLNFLTIIIVQALLLTILPRFMIEDTWTIGKEILKYLILFFCITIVLVLAHVWYLDITIQVRHFFTGFINVLLLASIPIAAAIAYNYHKELKFSLSEAQQLNQQIQEIESNYIDIFYLENGQKSKKPIRTTLRKMEQNHGDLKQFARCHRTYIVNLDKVDSFEGNSRGYIITLIDDLGNIPVSRGYIDKIKESLSKS